MSTLTHIHKQQGLDATIALLADAMNCCRIRQVAKQQGQSRMYYTVVTAAVLPCFE